MIKGGMRREWAARVVSLQLAKRTSKGFKEGWLLAVWQRDDRQSLVRLQHGCSSSLSIAWNLGRAPSSKCVLKIVYYNVWSLVCISVSGIPQESRFIELTLLGFLWNPYLPTVPYSFSELNHKKFQTWSNVWLWISPPISVSCWDLPENPAIPLWGIYPKDAPWARAPLCS